MFNLLDSGTYLIFWRVVALRKVPADLPVVQQVVVDQVPAPALVVAAQQGHVALALHGRPLGGDAYHRHRAQGPLPPDLPGVPPFREADLAPCAVRALGDGVAVQREAVLLHVDVAGAVVGAQTVLIGLELQIRNQTAGCSTLVASHSPKIHIKVNWRLVGSVSTG